MSHRHLPLDRCRRPLCAAVAAIGLVCASAPLKAEGMKLGCNSYSPLKTMFSDVCWSGMFPMRIAGATFMKGKSGVPSDATGKAICVCGGNLAKGQLPKIGFTVGFWAPSKIIDITRKPYCLPSLGGLEIPVGGIDFINGGANRGRGQRQEAFANWILYSAPLIYMLRLLDEGACPSDGLLDFDVMHMSPLFPTQNDVTGRYTTFLNPEMMLLANAKSFLAMPVDAVSSTLGNPINNLFWVAGAWGQIYPMTGFNGMGRMVDPVRFSSLMATRSIAMLHRLGLMNETIGDDNLCERNARFILRKDAFRWQMLAPSPEGGRSSGGGGSGSSGQVRLVNPPTRGGTCTHATGAGTAGWGMWRDVPATGEDHTYMLFQWTDCCFGLTPGS
ncbi:TraU family protein [Allochromatium tepidum]|uniref:Conjugal transfer protein TraU n=1 Tax=Allochromatium tepidum TaxID=553982 RepID=A0ABN6GH08_9GAMM|nr:TraU family protein [Allochromatium tepidum]BCU08439.1 conjugal transfer protein TraU [Allochromatium tepidum]